MERSVDGHRHRPGQGRPAGGGHRAHRLAGGPRQRNPHLDRPGGHEHHRLQNPAGSGRKLPVRHRPGHRQRHCGVHGLHRGGGDHLPLRGSGPEPRWGRGTIRHHQRHHAGRASAAGGGHRAHRLAGGPRHRNPHLDRPGGHEHHRLQNPAGNGRKLPVRHRPGHRQRHCGVHGLHRGCRDHLPLRGSGPERGRGRGRGTVRHHQRHHAGSASAAGGGRGQAEPARGLRSGLRPQPAPLPDPHTTRRDQHPGRRRRRCRRHRRDFQYPSRSTQDTRREGQYAHPRRPERHKRAVVADRADPGSRAGVHRRQRTPEHLHREVDPTSREGIGRSERAPSPTAPRG